MNTKNATLITAIVALVAAAIILVPAIDVDADSIDDGTIIYDDSINYGIFVVDDSYEGQNFDIVATDEEGRTTVLTTYQPATSWEQFGVIAVPAPMGSLDRDSHYYTIVAYLSDDEEQNAVETYDYGTPSTEGGGEGEETPDVPEAEIASISVSGYDAEYTVGDTLDMAVLTVTGYDADGSEIGAVEDYTVTYDGEAVTSYTFEAEDEYTFTVSVGSISTEFTVTVTASTTDDGDEDEDGSGETVPDYTADREFTNTITLGDGNVVDDESSITASATQEVVISGDVTVTDGGYLKINGKLTIEEGATLTIEEGGYVFIDTNGIVDVQGTLDVEAGSEAQPSFEYSGLAMTVSGSVYLIGADSFTSTGSGISISGYFEVGQEATADLSGVTVAAGGEVLVNGSAITAMDNEMTVSGTLTIDSEGVPTEDGADYVENGTVYMYVDLGADGTVVVTNLHGTVVIDDVELAYVRSSGNVDATYDNTITLTDVAGVTVTETAATSGSGNNMSYDNVMYISGSVSTAVDYLYSNDLNPIIALDGQYIEVSDDLTLGSGVYMTVSGALTVSGTVTATAESNGGQVSGDGEITVTGKMTISGNRMDTGASGTIKFNASVYASSPTYVYTTLETALDDGATAIYVLGVNHVYEEATIPVGTNVTLQEDRSVLYIDDDATLTVSAEDNRSAKLYASSADYSIRVNGTLVIEDWSKSGIRNAVNILSDTYTADGDGRTYTSIYNALDIAEDGATVTVSRNQGGTAPEDDDLRVVLDEDLTVPEGVTLDIPKTSTITQEVVVGSGVTVTIDGTVIASGSYTITEEDGTYGEEGYVAPGATVVNGLFLYEESDDLRENYTRYIDGAYFTYSSSPDMYAIAPLESMPGLMDYVTSDETYNASYIFLVGDTTVGDVDFSAYEGDDRVWLVAGVTGDDLTASSITLGDGVEFYAYGGSTAGTIVLANGEVELSGVYGIVAYNSTAGGVTTSYIANYDDDTVDTPADADGIQSAGSVEVSGEVSSSISTTEYVSVTVSGTATLTAGDFEGDVTVTGSAVIAGSGVTFASLTVTGDVAAAEESSYSASADAIYVGVAENQYYLAGEGSVSDVNLTSGNLEAVAYVSPNATYEAARTLVSTEYYAENELVLTAYAHSGNDVKIDIPFSIENARFDGWYYYDENGDAQPVVVTTGTGSEAVTTYVKVGAENATEVYASIIYDIYYVFVVADSGIGSVAIGGNVLINYTGNIYVMPVNLTAGTYEVTYTLASGYTDDGVTLSSGSEYASTSGMRVTLSGEPDYENGEYEPIYLYLSGTSATDTSIVVNVDNGDDDGMSITDWLLVILVILIIIMAIIVALRLRRS